MLVDPTLKYLTLGIHPEINTDLTRVIESDYEDPYIQPSEEEIDELKQQQQKKVELYRTKIEQFIGKMRNRAENNVTIHEKQVINEVKAFIDRNKEFKELQALKGELGQLIQNVSQKSAGESVKFQKQTVKYDTSYQVEMNQQMGIKQKEDIHTTHKEDKAEIDHKVNGGVIKNQMEQKNV